MFLQDIYIELCASLKCGLFGKRNHDKDGVTPARDVIGASAARDGNVARARAECFVNRILDSHCCVSETALLGREGHINLSKTV